MFVDSCLKTYIRRSVVELNNNNRKMQSEYGRLDKIKEMWITAIKESVGFRIDYDVLAIACSTSRAEIVRLDKRWRTVHDLPQQQTEHEVMQGMMKEVARELME